MSQTSYSLNAANPSKHINNVTDSSGQVHNDSKLYCSILSGLPNELNFSLNVATILSNSNHFDWNNDYIFVNVLLDSLKSYCCVCHHELEDEVLGKVNELTLFKELHKNFVLSSNSKSDFEYGPDESSEFNCDKSRVCYIDNDCNCFKFFWYQNCFDEEVLSSALDDDNQSINLNYLFSSKSHQVQYNYKIEKRIETIAGIIRNISFTYDQSCTNNVSMVPLLKFILLLLKSENVRFVNYSLDILSNISPALSFSTMKTYTEDFYSLLNLLLINVVDIALNSDNIYETTKSFEIMASFLIPSNSEANAMLLSLFENKKVSFVSRF